jgi:excisionase family DNA binding protein
MVASDRLTLTVEEAAALLGISRTLAYELVRQGTIPSLRLGRRRLVPVHALNLMLQEAAPLTAP